MKDDARARRYGRLTTATMMSRLTPQAKLLDAVLDWHAPTIKPTTERLAIILGCSRRSVIRYRNELSRFVLTGMAAPDWWRTRARSRAVTPVSTLQQPSGSSLSSLSESESERNFRRNVVMRTPVSPPQTGGRWGDGDSTLPLFPERFQVGRATPAEDL